MNAKASYHDRVQHHEHGALANEQGNDAVNLRGKFLFFNS